MTVRLEPIRSSWSCDEAAWLTNVAGLNIAATLGYPLRLPAHEVARCIAHGVTPEEVIRTAPDPPAPFQFPITPQW